MLTYDYSVKPSLRAKSRDIIPIFENVILLLQEEGFFYYFHNSGNVGVSGVFYAENGRTS